MNTHYQQLMKDAIALHDKKSHDYAKDDDPYSNFTRAAEIVSWFKNPIDQVFACMIGIKLARLAELLNGKEPNNESMADSHIDHVNYAALWGSFHAGHVKFEPVHTYECGTCGTFSNGKSSKCNNCQEQLSPFGVQLTNIEPPKGY